MPRALPRATEHNYPAMTLLSPIPALVQHSPIRTTRSPGFCRATPRLERDAGRAGTVGPGPLQAAGNGAARLGEPHPGRSRGLGEIRVPARSESGGLGEILGALSSAGKTDGQPSPQVPALPGSAGGPDAEAGGGVPTRRRGRGAGAERPARPPREARVCRSRGPGEPLRSGPRGRPAVTRRRGSSACRRGGPPDPDTAARPPTRLPISLGGSGPPPGPPGQACAGTRKGGPRAEVVCDARREG